MNDYLRRDREFPLFPRQLENLSGWRHQTYVTLLWTYFAIEEKLVTYIFHYIASRKGKWNKTNLLIKNGLVALIFLKATIMQMNIFKCKDGLDHH